MTSRLAVAAMTATVAVAMLAALLAGWVSG
jgi:hypothetical protein